MPKYELKFMYDWLSPTCIWSENDTARDKYDYSVRMADLPISKGLVTRLEELCRRHDGALDWNDPRNGILWPEEQQERFLAEARDAYNRLCDELGNDYTVRFIDKI